MRVYYGDFVSDGPREEEEVEKQQVWRDRARVERSWERIFELERGDPAWYGDPSTRSIQATLWYVRLGEVRKMTWFTAR